MQGGIGERKRELGKEEVSEVRLQRAGRKGASKSSRELWCGWANDEDGRAGGLRPMRTVCRQ